MEGLQENSYSCIGLESGLGLPLCGQKMSFKLGTSFPENAYPYIPQQSIVVNNHTHEK